MALVAYDDSDIEDSDENAEENNEIAEKEILKNHKERPVVTVDTSLFSSLPQPKKDFRIENDDVFLHKREDIPKDQILKKPPRVQITIPLLSKSVNEKPLTNVDIPIHNKGKARLLNMLPEPKFTKSLPDKIKINKSKFIPRSVDTTKVKDVEPKKLQKTNTKSVVNLEAYGSDESDSENVSNSDKNEFDFFSLNSAHVEHFNGTEDCNTEVIIDHQSQAYNIEPGSSRDEEQLTSCSSLTSFNLDHSEGEKPMPEVMQEEFSSETESSNHESMQLDEEAIIKLCGRKGRFRRENVQIIDINQKEILPDSREWLLKAITEDSTKRVSSKRRGDEPTHVQKRKHQITYLAHQAKANEQDLQNQWSNNRMSRRQTQSKYGF